MIMTINVTNDGAVKLLQDLEGLGLIQVSVPAQHDTAKRAAQRNAHRLFEGPRFCPRGF
jgi:hypothetical protein